MSTEAPTFLAALISVAVVIITALMELQSPLLFVVHGNFTGGRWTLAIRNGIYGNSGLHAALMRADSKEALQ